MTQGKLQFDLDRVPSPGDKLKLVVHVRQTYQNGEATKSNWMEIKKDGKFEFKVREGQRFRISALYPGAKDWKHLQFHTGIKSLTTFFTAKGDVGPIVITLERSATRP